MQSTPQTNQRQTLDQRRAADAWSKIDEIFKNDKFREDYTGEAHKLPVRIMASGLGQALVFLFAKQKKKPGLERLLSDLSNWVLKERIIDSAIVVPIQKNPDLLRAIVDPAADSEFLRWATDETLAYLQWINRFAEGLGGDESKNSDKRQ